MKRLLLHTISSIGLTAAAVLVVPGTASAAPEAVAERAGQIEAYLHTYPGLTPAEAADRVDGQAARAALLKRLSTEHAASFGGSWFDARTGVQHLNVVGSGTAGFTGLAANAGLRVKVHPAEYTMDELTARTDAIRADRTAAGAGRLGVGIDPQSNRVVVAVTSAAAARSALGAAATDPAVVTTVTTAVPAVPEACHSRYNCSAPLRSGVALRQAGTNLCSVGFTVRDGNGTRWTVTAGHCMRRDGEIWSHNTVDIGPIGNAWIGDNIDVARIRMNRAPWADASGGWLYNEGNPNSPVALNSAVTRYAQIQQGDSVCLQGYNSNARHSCGVITHAAHPDYNGMTRVDFDGCQGDSGGGWYAPNSGNRTAYGTHVGGPLTCHSQYGWSVFSPLPALNAFWDRHSATTIRVETR
ncbi:streptogrisin C [Lentzea albidocapillata subsp. violacea]|uniref:Streptogrisin C n=1 Tax=Lentzea albidocapillata subsp. violacea TaxID=128104 RepID=A0A1G9FD43_9PSEU|nr:S1 family peptidase [Lentzea albidocapillata]SDK86299.1 streptogrisin C [Lentzea albidocapillata subsp. violacea]